jgi:radical SAM superfamily enzyme YgiQ (UPF0313 family)
MDILTGRGCQWGHCTYCLWVHSYIKGPVYNCRSVANVIDEMRHITTKMPFVKSLMFQDDTMTEDRARELSEGMLNAGIQIPWSCYARGNMSQDVLRLMKQAGCLNLHVGYESADEAILKNIRKGITKDIMTEFTANARKTGLHIHGDFAIGFPGETKTTIRKTVAWACAIRPDTAQFQLMIPFTGTRYHEQLKDGGWLKCGLPDYPDLTAKEMEKMTRWAYRRFYISLPYLWSVLQHPYVLFFSRLSIYWRAVVSIFWGRYIR